MSPLPLFIVAFLLEVYSPYTQKTCEPKTSKETREATNEAISFHIHVKHFVLSSKKPELSARCNTYCQIHRADHSHYTYVVETVPVVAVVAAVPAFEISLSAELPLPPPHAAPTRGIFRLPTTINLALIVLAAMIVLAVFLLLSLAALLPPATPAPLFLPLELLQLTQAVLALCLATNALLAPAPLPQPLLLPRPRACTLTLLVLM